MNFLCILISPIQNMLHSLIEGILSAAVYIGLGQAVADILNPIFAPILSCGGR